MYIDDWLFVLCVFVVGELGEEDPEEFEQYVHWVGNSTGTEGIIMYISMYVQ